MNYKRVTLVKNIDMKIRKIVINIVYNKFECIRLEKCVVDGNKYVITCTKPK